VSDNFSDIAYEKITGVEDKEAIGEG